MKALRKHWYEILRLPNSIFFYKQRSWQAEIMSIRHRDALQETTPSKSCSTKHYTMVMTFLQEAYKTQGSTNTFMNEEHA